MEEVLIKDVLENLDIIPTNIDLSGAEIELLDVESAVVIALIVNILNEGGNQ